MTDSLRYHFTSVRMASSKSIHITNVGEGVEKKEHLHIVGGNVAGIVTMENSMEVP